MKTGGWIFMLIAWGTIIGLAVWCVKRVVFDLDKKAGPDERPTVGETGEPRETGQGPAA